jgi:DNA-binding MarR family transcriptional regulator
MTRAKAAGSRPKSRAPALLPAARGRKPAEPGPKVKPFWSLDTELGYLIARARRTSWNRVAQGLEAHGDSVYAWNLLNHLSRLGSATQRELAAATAQHPAGVSRQLDELEKQGQVARRRAKTDRRKMVVALTPRGRSALAAMRPAVQVALQETLGVLTAAEKHVLLKLLRRIVEGS